MKLYTILITIGFIIIFALFFNEKNINTHNADNYIYTLDSINRVNDSLCKANETLNINILLKSKSDSIIITKIKYIELKKSNFQVINIDSNLRFLFQFIKVN